MAVTAAGSDAVKEPVITEYDGTVMRARLDRTEDTRRDHAQSRLKES